MQEYFFNSRRQYLCAIHHMARCWSDRPFYADELLAYYDYDDATQSFKMFDEKGNHIGHFLREFGRPNGIAFVIPRGQTKPKLVPTDLMDGRDWEAMLKFYHGRDEIESYDRNFPNHGLHNPLTFKDHLLATAEPIYSSKKKHNK